MTKKTIIVAAVLLLAAALFVGAGAATGDATEETGVAEMNREYYSTVQLAIDSVTSSESTTITILKNVDDGAGFGFKDSTSGKNIVIDFGHYTYLFKSPGVGSVGTQNQGMHFGTAYDENGNALNSITLKNGVVGYADGTEMKRLLQSYSNLELDNMVLDDSNGQNDNDNYATSICSGNVVITGDTKIILRPNDGTMRAFDVDGSYSSATKKVSVTFDEGFDGSIEGVIEYSGNGGDNANSALIIKGNGDFSKAEIKTTNVGSTTKATVDIYSGTFSSDVAKFIVPGYADQVKIVKSDSIDVTYDVADSFILTIPSDLNFNTAIEIQDTVNIIINSLTPNKKVQLTMKSQNFVAGDSVFKLKLPAGNDFYSYTIKCGEVVQTPAESIVLMTTAETAEEAMVFNLGTTTSKVAGSYKDVLTFTADVVDGN